MNVRDFISKRLEKYAERHERRDDQFAELFIRNVDALSNRRTLKRHLAIGGTVNLLIWASVLFFPHDVSYAWQTVQSLENNISAVVIGTIFGIGFWLTYALFRLKFPDLEIKRFDGEILTSFHESEHSIKRYRVWLASVTGGVLNVLLLVIVDIYLVAGW
jgi:hypothetical protein